MSLDFPSNPSIDDTYTYSGRTWVWNGSGWKIQLDPSNTIATQKYVATEGQTVFNISYTVPNVEVFLNGIKLNSSEFTATDGATIILSEGATAGDVVDLIGFSVFTLG